MSSYIIKDYDRFYDIYETLICNYCGITNYGDASVNTGPYNLCEGGNNFYNCNKAMDYLVNELDTESQQELLYKGIIEKRSY